MKRMSVAVALVLSTAGAVCAQKPPLLPEKDVAALAGEVSGARAKRNVEEIAKYHRQRGSKGYRAAAEFVAGELKKAGLSGVEILQFPADGKIFYGTQRSRPAWDAEVGELREVVTEIGGEEGSDPKSQTAWASDRLIKKDAGVVASFLKERVALAEDSESADVTAELVDVGAGTRESDYVGKNVKGKIVLVSAQPGAVQDLAVGKFGAAGIVSYAQNQKTAWSGENKDAVRWGHLETFSPNKTFAFMVSLRTAESLKQRLASGEHIKLHAKVKAGQHAGNYEVVTATIPGADEKYKEEEIVFSCHLDHQMPGANDNASGCATILEIARTLQKLIEDGKLTRPVRTIRFVFPPEIEGTLALLNGKPELAKRIKAVVHMDMVGGEPETKAVFHVTQGPMSLPSFVHDVAWAFADWVNEETYKYAATGKSEYPLVESEGGKAPLRAEFASYTMGSDHDVYQDSSFGIPAIYMNDWPDRYIHTNLDKPENIDATKLKRVGLIGAASGYFLAGMNVDAVPAVLEEVDSDRLKKWSEAGKRKSNLSSDEWSNLIRQNLDQALLVIQSTNRFAPNTKTNDELRYEILTPVKHLAVQAGAPKPATGDGLLIFRRKTELRGPLVVFGFDYFSEEWKKRGHATSPKLLEYEGLWGGGEAYGYEVLNFADGKRNAQEIHDAVAAEYGPVPIELVAEYLKALEEIGAVERVK